MAAIADQEGGGSEGWGPVSRYVKSNLKRVREARGLSTTALAAALEATGQPIPATGITRIEKGRRRVDADDLAALALVLNVSPLTLLLPPEWGEGAVQLTDRKRVQSRTAWLWGQGVAPAEDMPAAVADEDGGSAQQRGRDYYKLDEDFRALALPDDQRRAADHPANREAEGLAQMVGRLVQTTETRGDDPAAVKRSLRAARLRLRKLEAELEQIEITAEELGELVGE
ncbi:helix-turn-helix domain-containing protein [Streptomyces sp. NPDC048484]|uniref:helix-turn-helix domain-containing protein n=1 Tax=Streptomyces sp. NPDC048484 TaxID=3155146 RepID=UPI0034158B87